MKNDLRVVIMENTKELGDKVLKCLLESDIDDKDILVPISNSRFNNGEGKISLKKSVREKDLYILSDVGNYDMTYKMHDIDNHMSPDDHFQDIKRVISATNGSPHKITVIMPLLYQSRQHKRKGRESLDCALALQELQDMGVSNIVTFDAHDPNIANAIPSIPFDNFYTTNIILKNLLNVEDIELNNLLVVSPDLGAMERSRYYADVLKCNIGFFYKRRDLTEVKNGKNKIIEHVYLGPDVIGKDIIVVDDMIASGSSMIEVANELKNRGARKVYLIATFALLTEGPDIFINAYEKNIFNKLYTTNLSYVSDKIKSKDWYENVDCSSFVSEIILTLNKRKSIETLFENSNDVTEIIELLKKEK